MPIRLLSTVLFILILSACGPGDTQLPLQAPTDAPAAVPTAAPTSESPVGLRPDWRRDWLRGDPCAPPCFMGITPGTLSQTETLALLRESLPDTPLELKQDPAIAQGVVRWLTALDDPQSGASAIFYRKPAKLYAVPLNTIVAVRLGYDGVLPLSEVIAAYGEPSHVLALAEPSSPGRTFFSVMVAYLDHGFNLTLDFEYDGQQPILDPDMLVTKIHFFPPSLAGFEGAIGPSTSIPEIGMLLVPWQGFVEFADYCREVPSPTDPNRTACP